MTTKQLRELFARDTLPHRLLDDPAEFYTVFGEGEAEVISWMTALWEQLCQGHGQALREHPFFPDITFWLVDETEENFTCMMDVYLPASGPSPALYAALVFGATMDPRYFTGLSGKAGEVALVELLPIGEGLSENACGILDGATPESERRQAFMEQVYAVCDAYSAEN